MRPLILITNDDGVYSPGLLAAAEAVMGLGELLICAPRYQQTGMGRSFPRSEDLGIIEEIPLQLNQETITAYGVHGSPAYAVAHGVLELSNRLPDLCISGINYGENVGHLLSCSGTVGAALEAGSHGIPAIAVSKQVDLSIQRDSQYAALNWDIDKEITREIARMALFLGLPGTTSMLNINVPDAACSAADYVWTRQSRQNYFPFQKPAKRDLNLPYQMQSKLLVDLPALEKDSDIYAIYVDHKISVTPLTWDMTDYKAIGCV